MDKMHFAKVTAMAPFESFEEYTANRVFPPAFRIARASIFLFLCLGFTDFFLIQDREVFINTLPYRVIALVALILMTIALNFREFAQHRVTWTFIFGLVAEIAMIYWYLFLLHQSAAVVFIIMYFLFGVLTIASAVTVSQYIWAAALTVGQVAIQLGLNHLSIETLLQIGLFVVSALVFLGHAVHTQRKSAKELWALATENHYHATIDMLSQVLNRGTWYIRSTQILNNERRNSGEAVAFIMIDIDHFKNINDTWGHEAGDLVIRKVAESMISEVREGDLVGRLGGEEFGILLPGADESYARIISERIRHRVEALIIKHEDQIISVTISLGFYTTCHKDSLEPIIHHGDECLYRAKHNGRNRVEGQSSGGS